LKQEAPFPTGRGSSQGRFHEKLKELEARKCEEWAKQIESQKELLEKRKLTDEEILHIEAGKELKKGMVTY